MRFDLHGQDGSYISDIELSAVPRKGEYILMSDGISVSIQSIVWFSNPIERDTDAGICPGRGSVARLFVEAT